MEPLQLFKILGDQTRLDIVLLLKASGELCVCDIYTALNLSQPKTSRHLAMLRESGLCSIQNMANGFIIVYLLHYYRG